MKRLVDNGLIESSGSEEWSPHGGKRKYFRITELGRATLEEELRLYEGFKRKPDMYDKADAA